MRRCQIALLSAAAIMGCNKPTPPPALPPSATTSSQPESDQTKTPPEMPAVPPGRLVYCPEEARILEKLLGCEARVYQFAGTFIECWLEFESSDGLSARSDVVRIDEALFRRNMGPDQESFDIARHMHGWLVVRGDFTRSLDLHLREVVQVAEDRTSSWTTPASHLDLPERKGASHLGYVFMGSFMPDRVELPNEPGKEFTIFSTTWPEHDFTTDARQVLREVTLQLKGRVLGGDQSAN